MGRKVFISILGTGIYEFCKYQDLHFVSKEVRFVQEAVLESIGAINWRQSDAGFILLTSNARKANWDRNISSRKRFDEIIPYESLEKRLEEMNLPFLIKTPNIPDGKNETEMWEIFKILFDLVKDDDELYFDLTHSFRYLPMMLLVFGNYVKFLKKAKVIHLSYGNYEARDTITNIAPIIDLVPISTLQDWTFASANYLENGNVSRLVRLCNEELNPMLRNEATRTENALLLNKFVSRLDKVIDERINCRGISIVTSDNLKYLKQTANKLSNTFIDPLNPVFEKIKDSLIDFDEKENVMNGFSAVKWCLDFGLYQQAATILIENIVTYICLKNSLNWKSEADRLLVNSAFKVTNEPIPETEWKVSNKEIEKSLQNELIEIVKRIKNSIEVNQLVKQFISLSDLRNDFNHAGMRNCPMPSERLKSTLIERFNSVMQIITSC